MNARDTRRYDSFTRVEVFGEKNASDFAPDSLAAKTFAAVARVRQKLDQAKAGQNPALPSKGTLLDAIRLDLLNLTRTAAAIDQAEPGFADKFPSPDNANERALVTAADKALQQLAAQPGTAPRPRPPRWRSRRNLWCMK